jgi:ATP-dependent Clp protease ATP-binding subunit ClpB
MGAIVGLQIARLQALLADRKLTLSLDDSAAQWLADAGYDPVYGARPLKRVIQRALQNPLANMILAGTVAEGSNVHVGTVDGALAINGQVIDDNPQAATVIAAD